MSLSDSDSPDTLVERIHSLRDELSSVKRESHLRLRRLQRSQAETDTLKNEIEALNIEIADLREENRLAALEHNRLRATHAEEVEKLRKLTSEPRKRFVELESIITSTQQEKSTLAEKLNMSMQEIDELRGMLNDARETIEGYKVELESKGPSSRQELLDDHGVKTNVAIQTAFEESESDSRNISRRVTFSLPSANSPFQQSHTAHESENGTKLEETETSSSEERAVVTKAASKEAESKSLSNMEQSSAFQVARSSLSH
ncbi:hypothetical protein HDU96_006049 [Phlyctochytrium bullatum]|nr:hypothetical protein HDU96_006049 [Phlyctochytrium bullatum]